MSGFTQVGVGSSANDGTGDALRVAYQAINGNYTSTVRSLASTTDLGSELAASGYVRIVYTGARAGIYRAVETATSPNGVTEYASATVGWIWRLENFLDAARVISTTTALNSEPASDGNVVIVTGSARPGVYLAETSAESENGYNIFDSATTGVIWRALNFYDFSIHGQIEAPLTQTYVLALKFGGVGLIQGLTVQTDAGTLDCDVAIDGTSVTSLDSVTASSVVSTTSATALNGIAENSKITLALTNIADVNSLFFTLTIV